VSWFERASPAGARDEEGALLETPKGPALAPTAGVTLGEAGDVLSSQAVVNARAAAATPRTHEKVALFI
jgi:hypothetical protein